MSKSAVGTPVPFLGRAASSAKSASRRGLLAVMREQKATVVFHEAQVLNLIRLVVL